MTTKQRASLGFDNAFESFDPAAIQPSKPRPSNERPDPAAARKAAEEAGFQSRQPAPAKPVAPEPALQRRRRNYTGRTEQVNVRATPEFKARFQAIVAKAFSGDTVAFERAVELLEKEYGL